MKKQVNPNNQAYLLRAAFYLLMLVALCAIPFALAQRNVTKPGAATELSQRTLSFEERVAYQRAIEEVYWRHRIWPKERPDPKPSLEAVMSQTQIEKKVEDYLRDSEMLEGYWQRPITADQLQAEMDRMGEHTKEPEVLRELFEALDNDPFVIAECLARPTLSERSESNSYVYEQRLQGVRGRAEANVKAEQQMPKLGPAASANYTLPRIPDGLSGCIDNWVATSTTNAPSARYSHTAVWTGSEMIVWGGYYWDGNYHYFQSGGRYNPSTDSWTPTSTSDAPSARNLHTAVWSGTEMIVWGGFGDSGDLNTGGKYNPSTDSWTATSTSNAPSARNWHTAVWSGTEMIVWGGGPGFSVVNTGGRYNPITDTWALTSTANAPDGRGGHTAVWKSGEMIVWGGGIRRLPYTRFNTGGRYDPSTNTWTATSTTNAPSARVGHTAVWTGTEMIVWGGSNDNTGGRYNPSTNSWTATSTTNAPSARSGHSGVWTGSEMIAWGGFDGSNVVNTGGRYDSTGDTWSATSTTNAPGARTGHRAVWSGSEMIVWGGDDESGNPFNSGGSYCAQSGPTPTPTPCIGRCNPTPRPRPTPAPRP
jgi:N-acetylneuraminic acid mutarotase